MRHSWEHWKEFRQEKSRFAKAAGVCLDRIAPGEAWGHMLIEERHTNPFGVAHGGALMTMADNLMGAAGIYLEEKIASIDFQYQFMRAVRPGDRVDGHAHVIKEGSSILFVELELYVGDQQVGKAISTLHRSGVPIED